MHLRWNGRLCTSPRTLRLYLGLVCLLYLSTIAAALNVKIKDSSPKTITARAALSAAAARTAAATVKTANESLGPSCSVGCKTFNFLKTPTRWGTLASPPGWRSMAQRAFRSLGMSTSISRCCNGNSYSVGGTLVLLCQK